MISLNTLSNICFYMLLKCLALFFDSSLSLDWITSVSESLETIGWNTILSGITGSFEYCSHCTWVTAVVSYSVSDFTIECEFSNGTYNGI